MTAERLQELTVRYSDERGGKELLAEIVELQEHCQKLTGMIQSTAVIPADCKVWADERIHELETQCEGLGEKFAQLLMPPDLPLQDYVYGCINYRKINEELKRLTAENQRFVELLDQGPHNVFCASHHENLSTGKANPCDCWKKEAEDAIAR